MNNSSLMSSVFFLGCKQNEINKRVAIPLGREWTELLVRDSMSCWG